MIGDQTTDRYRRAAEAFIAHPLLKAGVARDETVAWWATQPSFQRAVDANRATDEAAGREAAAQALLDDSRREITDRLTFERAAEIARGEHCGE